eukprot:1140378-Pelagomonas_calceolata.AAC.2
MSMRLVEPCQHLIGEGVKSCSQSLLFFLKGMVLPTGTAKKAYPSAAELQALVHTRSARLHNSRLHNCLASPGKSRQVQASQLPHKSTIWRSAG